MRQIYLLLALLISTQTLAQSSVEVIEINVLDRSFTGVLVEITMEHDGSLGDDVFFGATPVTDSGIHGFSYTPNRLEEGIFSVNAFLSNELECDGHSAVVGLINVVEWHAKQGSQPELFRALVTHNDTGELVYLLSGMRDAPQILGSLVQNGIGLDEPDINGLTPVLNAIYSSNHVALENLAIAGADLNRLDSDNGSALLAAIVNDDEQAVRILLSHKADPALELPYGFSVLGIKDQIENQVIIELLERYSGVSI